MRFPVILQTKIAFSKWKIPNNASCHRDVTTLNWFNKKKIENFDWPTFSSDLNPIKNLWGLLAHLV